MAKINQYKKVKNTNLIFASIITFLIVAIVVVLLLPNQQQKIYNAYAKQEGNTLQQDHILKQVKVKKVVELAKGDEYVFVYYGTDTCTNCAAAIGQINEELSDAGVKTIYYLQSNDSYKLSDSDSKYLTENIEGNIKPNGTPQLWVLKDGKVVLNSDDYIDDEDNIKWSYFLRTCVDLIDNEE